MPQQLDTSVENNFTKGLITESTGLNFPENAATDCDNCEFTLIGDVLRREGIDFETNHATTNISRTSKAISTYKWDNAGGDGSTQVVVAQVGNILKFYKSSAATTSSPLSAQILASTVDVSTFVALGGSFDATAECTYANGNGYLFVYHPSCDPIYCTYNAGVITGAVISLQIRDFVGIQDGLPVLTRPTTLSTDHNYNLTNQGWTASPAWSAYDSTTLPNPPSFPVVGSQSFTVASGIVGITNGQNVLVTYEYTTKPSSYNAYTLLATVTGYSGTTITLSVSSVTGGGADTVHFEAHHYWYIRPIDTGYLSTWFSAEGNYPSNADVWWYFKDTSDVFDPAATQGNVSLGSGQAPAGHYLLNAFNQDRSSASGLSGITTVGTLKRPTNGAWFQGRVWYAGVADAQQASTDVAYYTWTENIYFSQIVQTPTDFGQCYQQNDPTSEQLFDLLPTDGGVITIQGAGPIYKLFPIQNALLVFAANGVWYITGSQGIGFSANDYTILKLSAVRSISTSSFVDVQGLAYFWNEEGIYSVQPAKQAGNIMGGNPLHVNPLEVEPITVGTILTYYNNIPLQSKKFARAAYDPINYNIQWIYRSTNESSVTNRYDFDKILNFNTVNSAFFPYTLTYQTTHPHIHSIIYVIGPGGSTSPDPTIKYFVANSDGAGSYNFTFAEEQDETYVDFKSYDTIGVNFVSYFVTGYKLRGQAIKKFQPQYVQIYSRTNGAASAYKIQGYWDFANDRNSNRWSSIQLISTNLTRFDTTFRRHKIRGRGFALQLKVISSDGMPFDIQGWAIVDTVNTGT